MKQVTQGWPVTDFQPPPNVEFARIDPGTGLIAADGEAPPPLAPDGGVADPGFVPFVTGTVPSQVAPRQGEPGDAPQNFFQDDR